IEIQAIGERWTGSPKIHKVTVGDRMSPEAARIAVRELTETGSYARGIAEAEPLGDGVLLRILVRPRPLIATIQMRGGVLDTIATPDAAGITEGGEITPPRLPEIGARIQAFYAQHGFTTARVTVDTSDTDDPMKVVVSIEIEPGTPRTISERVFVI